jgi:hypothetical protein
VTIVSGVCGVSGLSPSTRCRSHAERGGIDGGRVAQQVVPLVCAGGPCAPDSVRLPGLRLEWQGLQGCRRKRRRLVSVHPSRLSSGAGEVDKPSFNLHRAEG